MLLARRRLAAALICLGLGAVLGACGAEEALIVPSTSTRADTTTSVPDDSKVSATTSPIGSTSTTGHPDETTVTVSTTASSTTSTQPTTTTTSSSTTTAPATTTSSSTTTAPMPTTSTLPMVAPVLDHPDDGDILVIPGVPASKYGDPVLIWYTTWPASMHERFEWSACDGCPFTQQVISVFDPTYAPFAEVLLDLEQVSATHRWRVVAVYADGTELSSETRSFEVYAWYPVTISGTVTDASSGEAIGGVRLVLESGPASWIRYTSRGGLFDFTDGPGGSEPPTLTASGSGYETLVLPLNVGESVVLNLEMNPTP